MMVVCCVGPMGEDGKYLSIILSPGRSLMLSGARSQSRMRGDYLFYEEKMETTREEKDAKAVLRCLSFREKRSKIILTY